MEAKSKKHGITYNFEIKDGLYVLTDPNRPNQKIILDAETFKKKFNLIKTSIIKRST